MKLLFITQVVDKDDGVLGFVHGWLNELSKVFDSVEVVCLRKGKVELPGNIIVHSLGKEEGVSRVKYVRRFFSLIISLRLHYDNVFVHMNSEYVLLGGAFWRLWGKKIVLWYNHTYGNWKTKLAMKLAHTVCHTSPYSFTAGTTKSVRMPAGIDVNLFRRIDVQYNSDILYIGRISSVKNVDVLLEAIKILYKKGIRYKVKIIGPVITDEDESYKKRLEEARSSALEITKDFPSVASLITIIANVVPNKDVPVHLSASKVCVNLTPKGNYDKTVLEAAACGCIPIVSSVAFADALPSSLIFKERDSESLANVLERVLIMPEIEKNILVRQLRTYVVDTHSLQVLVKKIRGLYGN